jgi:transcriptional regulator with GAF, ATPase, and Fis domain
MAALTNWASEAPAINHTASFEIEEAAAAHFKLDRSALRGGCLPKISCKRFGQVIGNSPALQAVLEQVERVAPTDSTVLIQGETGTSTW